MFLKNWDMTRLKLITLNETGKSINEDQDSVFRYYNGNYGSFGISTSGNAYGEIFNYSINAWDTNGYPNNAIESGQFIWPGGDVDGVPARIRPSIERNNIKYEDFDLYAPFYGGTTPGSGQIYGQPHTVTTAIYNKELDQWEKTVTREFKNESGYTIVVRELGFYLNQVLMAREILETPIEVQHDGYFKMSFTYKVENPHENRTVKRVKQYSRTFVHDFYNSSSTDRQEDFSFSLNKNNGKVLIIAKWHTNTATPIIENYFLDLQGWQGKEIIEPFITKAESSWYFITRVYILTPEDNENNLVILKNSTTNSRYYNCTWCYLKNSILDISALPIGEDYYLALEQQEDSEVVLQKSTLEKHIIWVALSHPVFSAPKFYQKDLNFCDYDYVYDYSETSFLFDETDAEEHIIGFSHYNTAGNYRGYAFLKLQATTENDIPLYEDIPVQR